MADISVNEYVRSKDGIIGKFYEIDKNVRYYGERLEDVIYRIYVGNTQDYQYLRIKKEDITKHSPNIIDLIEEGDYVNGRYVQKITKTLIYFRNCSHRRKDELLVEDIVTHEQFNSMKYIVGGEE